MPAIRSSGLLRKGMLLRTGISQLAAIAAAAVLKPMYFRKSLLGVFALKMFSLPNSSKGSSSLNSSFNAFLFASLWLSSPKFCQYFFSLIFIQPRNKREYYLKPKTDLSNEQYCFVFNASIIEWNYF